MGLRSLVMSGQCRRLKIGSYHSSVREPRPGWHTDREKRERERESYEESDFPGASSEHYKTRQDKDHPSREPPLIDSVPRSLGLNTALTMKTPSSSAEQ